MKILHITPYYEPDFSYGGVVRAVSSLCRELVKLGHDVTVYTTKDKKTKNKVPLHTETMIGGVRVVYFRNLLNGFLPSPGLYSSSKNINQFDIIHTASFWQLFSHPAMKHAAKSNTPIVVSPHGCFSMLVNPSLNAFKHRLFYWTFNHRAFENVSALHFTAEIERDDAVALKLDVPSFTVANPLDCSEFDDMPTKSKSRSELGIDSQAKVIMFLGRLGWRKALDVLIKSFLLLTNTYSNSKLILAGPDFGEEENLKKLVASLNLEDKVIFTGMVNPEKRKTLLAASDIFTLTAYRGENFGIAAAEAMAAGVPVITSDMAGVSYDVQESGAGLVVPVNAQKISEGLLQMLSDKKQLKAMGKAGHNMVRTRYAEQLIAEITATAYQDILDQTRSDECNWQ